MFLHILRNNNANTQNRGLTLKVACPGKGHEHDRFLAILSMRSEPGMFTVCTRIITTLCKTSITWSWVVEPRAYGKRAPSSQFLRIYDAIHHLSTRRALLSFRDFDDLKTLSSFCRYFSEIWPVYLVTWPERKLRIHAVLEYAQLSLTR